jgi:hypothetical protein
VVDKNGPNLYSFFYNTLILYVYTTIHSKESKIKINNIQATKTGGLEQHTVKSLLSTSKQRDRSHIKLNSQAKSCMKKDLHVLKKICIQEETFS